jgi:hypothetical protein
MANNPILRKVVRRVAEALASFAVEKGWAQDEYGIYYRMNPDWDQVHFIFVAKGLPGQGSFSDYAEVRNYLAQKLQDEPDLMNMVGLVVRDYSQVEQGGIYSIGADYKEYWTVHKTDPKV